ncbi:uncharacterized protein PAC_15423 [Phialocephala subalpina]|uniref:Heterokaryon incompatibility domain-containing protein n=1 Tax=Phialocephala subalpina TaxID=576137 RepID=A0A1L7XKI4_9HELO|nr:uncharacterized protein PAC_15423 [Phialocephala subalpina]
MPDTDGRTSPLDPSDIMSQRAPETSAPASERGSDSTLITFNELCSLCKKIFLGDKSQNPQVSIFHSLEELENSARFSCHLCNHLMNSSRFREDLARVRATLAAKDSKENVEGNPAPRRELEAQLFRYSMGLSLCLRHTEGSHRDMVAEVSFLFADRPDKSKRFPDSPNTQSEGSWKQALQWTQHCSQDHLHCEPQIVPRDEWPTRLLDVGVAEMPTIKLRETSELDIPTLKYTTLSHCWGNNTPTRLLVSNYSVFKERIALDNLPKTFQEAIEVTRKLGLRFLWIDSLCIVQDSSLDWVKESGRMHLVYRNSYLTIAAAAAIDATGGLFNPRNPITMVPCYIEYDDGHQSRYALSTYNLEEEETGQGRSLVLFTRAWVFQERLLSSRSLIFGKRELYWECLELKASEVYPEGIPVSDIMPGLDMFGLRKERQQIHKESLISPWKYWSSIISRYSGLKLSHISDKLVAVAGLAADLHRTWQGVDYLAGLWSYRLRRGLLWHCDDGSPWRKPSYTAPSWSWASIDGSVSTNFDAPFFDGLVELLDAQLSLSSLANPYGMVKDGYIRLKAPLIRSMLQRGRIGRRWYIRAAGFKPQSPSTEEADDDESNSDLEMANIFPVSTIEINVILDDRATSDSLQTFAAYLMPSEAVLTQRETGLHLEGLVLMPTHLKQGQFRRIGYFYLRDYWHDLALTDDKVELNSSQQSSPTAEVNDSQGHSENQVAEDIETPYISVLDVVEAAHMLGLNSLSPVDNEVSRRFKDWLSKHEKESAQGLRRKDDPYCNGIVNRTLFGRYEDMAAYFPNITSFLNYVAVRMHKDLDAGELDEALYEEAHSDGYIVFHII